MTHPKIFSSPVQLFPLGAEDEPDPASDGAGAGAGALGLGAHDLERSRLLAVSSAVHGLGWFSLFAAVHAHVLHNGRQYSANLYVCFPPPMSVSTPLLAHCLASVTLNRAHGSICVGPVLDTARVVFTFSHGPSYDASHPTWEQPR